MISIDDYIIVKDKTTNRKHLAQVDSINGNSINATLEHRRFEEPVSAPFAKTDVLAVLGPKPATGSVYGVTVEPYWKTVSHPDWGQIRLFDRINKETWKSVNEGLSRAYAALEKRKLTGFMEEGNLITELRPSKGKNLGMYKFRQKGDTGADVVILRVQELRDASLYSEVTLHEAGHGVFYRSLQQSHRAAWVRAHKHYCTRVKHDAEALASIGKAWIASGSYPSVFLETLDEEQQGLFNLALGEMRGNYRLRHDSILDLLDSGSTKTLQEMWPTYDILYSDFEEVIGEYANTNASEFFAEAFRLFMTGRKIPKPIHELMSQQLGAARR